MVCLAFLASTSLANIQLSVAKPGSKSTCPVEQGSAIGSASHNPSESIPDEDPLDEDVTDAAVLAEVKLAARPSESRSRSAVPELPLNIISTERKWPLDKATNELRLPSFPLMIRSFLREQLSLDSSSEARRAELAEFDGIIKIFYSATATFRAPSDPSGITGMHREHIRATSSWRGAPRFDCVLVNIDPHLPGLLGLEIARIQTFFSFVHEHKLYQCALVHWFSRLGTEPHEDTGMWMVEPDYDEDGDPNLAIIHVDSIFRATHLLPAHQSGQFVSRDMTMHDSLDLFSKFYVNRFVDYHAFEVLF